jgi:hypothetical protein
MESVVVEKLKEWIINFLDKPQKNLNGWSPCPYAKTALVNDKIEFVYDNDLKSAVKQNIHILEQKDVLVVCFDKATISPTELVSIVSELNKELMKENIVVLEDHPDTVETINGVHMNFGEAGLLLVQSLDKLTDASDKLRKAGYYDCWSKDELDEVVNWR